MAHIAIDARIINSSTGRYVERLITYMQAIDAKNTYTILVRKKDKDFWKPTASNFSVKIAEFDNYSFGEQIGFKKLLDTLQPDLVHFCMPQQPLLYRGKTVTTFHDLTLLNTYNSDKNWFIFHAKQLVGRYAFIKALKSNAHIIAVSEFTRKEVLKLAPIDPAKVSTIYESSDVEKTTPKKLALPFKKYILYVGQQSDYKNIKRLGDAHQLLRQKYPNLGLVLAGKLNASARANQEYFEAQKYEGIHFTDFISDAELSWAYTHAEAYVFPSLMEGFGLPGLEAMSHNIPVVSSNATCLPEVYGKAAHYFNPLDTSDIARAIDDILSNKELQEKLIKAGQKQLKKYSWEKMAKETNKIYMNALKK